MLALIDADIVGFRCASSKVEEGGVRLPAPWGIIRARCDEMLHGILAATGADECKLWLSGDRNFRYDLYPEYKANRKAPRPPHLEDLKEYLVVEWGARVADGIEADDAIGIDASDNTVICSIDKDLRQIPGRHFNFVKGVLDVVSPQEGLLSFYRSCLIGDSSDNIPGVAGIGVVKASRCLPDEIDERTMFDRVRESFADDRQFLLVGDLLYIQRAPRDSWSKRVTEKGWISPDQSGLEAAAVSANSGSGSMNESSDSMKGLMTSLKTAQCDGILTSGTPTEVLSKANSDLPT